MGATKSTNGGLAMLKDWIQLTKPRILQLNLFAAFGGYWVASKWMADWSLLIWVLIGTALTMASSCVLNNIWDWELDQKMNRTKNRPLATGRLKPGAFCCTPWFSA
jgi:protoheme IX farnesyltransferase